MDKRTWDWDNCNYEGATSNWRLSLMEITKEQRPLTEAQYDDTNYTLNER